MTETGDVVIDNAGDRGSVVLIGAPGSGKTAVGGALAGLLGLPFLDTDAEVERRAGKPAGDVFVEDGEEEFRRLESDVALAALTGPDRQVIALGSGAVGDERIRAALAGAAVVYLEADFGTVARHAGLDRPRVVLPGNPRGRLRAMLAERHPVYQGLATLTLPAEDGPPERLAGQIAAGLNTGGEL